jgi:hypothetical protein
MGLVEDIEAIKTAIRVTQADLEAGMATAMANAEEGGLPPVEVTAGATARMLRVELDAVWKPSTSSLRKANRAANRPAHLSTGLLGGR